MFIPTSLGRTSGSDSAEQAALKKNGEKSKGTPFQAPIKNGFSWRF